MKRGSGLQRKTPLRRGKPLASSKGLARGKPIERGRAPAVVTDPAKASAPKRAKRIRARNPERKVAAFARNYAGPDGGHAAFVRSTGCACRGRTLLPEHDCQGRIEVAHVVPRGMGGVHGGWADTVGLCTRHHREAGEQRTEARSAFDQRYAIDLRALADALAKDRIAGLVRAWLADPNAVTGYDLEAMLGWTQRRTAPAVDKVQALVYSLGLSREHAVVLLGAAEDHP